MRDKGLKHLAILGYGSGYGDGSGFGYGDGDGEKYPQKAGATILEE